MSRKPLQFKADIRIVLVPLPPERQAAWDESMRIFAKWIMDGARSLPEAGDLPEAGEQQQSNKPARSSMEQIIAEKR